MPIIAELQSSIEVKAPRANISFRRKGNADFTFINLSEPRQSSDKCVKKIVRSNAMRVYHRLAKQKATKERAEKFRYSWKYCGGSSLTMTSQNQDHRLTKKGNSTVQGLAITVDK